jgi:hypothetical protein
MRQAIVDFSKTLHDWDGFGINYVEAAQTRDYDADPQEYGGFSTLSEAQRQEIIDLIFGDDGLKPGAVKMFLDSFHQDEPGEGYDWDRDAIDVNAYDHEKPTRWMRYFVREGLKRARARGDDLEIITTLYGPPAWTTKQRIVRGRDLDPERKYEVAKYVLSWTKYLREVEGFPVKWVGLHNEGEDWMRWPEDGTEGGLNHDYNMYWPPEHMRPMLDAQGMEDVGIAPGEPSNWYRFYEWGYADAIADDPLALKNLGLITSHGFFGRNPGRWFGDWRSVGIDILRAKRPDLHAWVTSTSWSNMDAFFVWEMHNNIYSAKVNAIIPWAAVQWSGKWVGGDPNPGTAFRIAPEGGNYTVEPGYYYYKQVCRAGQPGMKVARVRCNDSRVALIAFSSSGTKHPDAFVVINTADETCQVPVVVRGSEAASFAAYRTSPGEDHVALGTLDLRIGILDYEAPAGSVTTFYATRLCHPRTA